MSAIIIPKSLEDPIDFEEWLEKFELIARANDWDEETQLNNIGIFLKGAPFEKLREICAEEKEDFSTLKEKLRAKIFNEYTREIAKSKFQLCHQRYRENYEDWALGLKKLCKLAYPDLNAELQDMLCKDRFVEGIVDDNVRLWVRNFRPKVLDEAVLQATVLDNNFQREIELKNSALTGCDNENETKAEVEMLRQEVTALRKELKQLVVGTTTKTTTIKPIKSAPVCWCCGSDEHFLESCKEKPEAKSMLYVDGFIGFAKVPVKMVIDTGASVSLLREDLWRKCGCPTLENNAKKLSIIGLNGQSIPVIGNAAVSFCIENVSIHFQFFVVPNAIAECIVGVDCLKAMQCDINLSTNELILYGKKVDLHEFVLRQECVEDNVEEFELGALVRVVNIADGPFVVKAKLSDATYRIQSTKSNKRIRFVVDSNRMVKVK